jgi:hypothetical protein
LARTDWSNFRAEIVGKEGRVGLKRFLGISIFTTGLKGRTGFAFLHFYSPAKFIEDLILKVSLIFV